MPIKNFAAFIDSPHRKDKIGLYGNRLDISIHAKIGGESMEVATITMRQTETGILVVDFAETPANVDELSHHTHGTQLVIL